MSEDLKFCPKCGAKIDDQNDDLCKICGAELRGQQKESAPSPIRIEKKIEPAVKLQPNYASFGERLIAFILDIIIISIISQLMFYLINLPIFLLDPIEFAFKFQNLWSSSFLIWGIGFLYYWLLEAYNKGQTLGKIALKLRTVDADTLEIAQPVNYAINNLAKPSPFLILDLLIGIFVSDGDLKNRIRVLQNLSNTVVISTKK
ncbi:MAG: zinc-ribbon domain-containing protein [Promethearchaeota archaeon]|nr:MAG: zinc-ribbon domain-containing protein [Candidatus Lokiarchaeota archaeon]